MMITILMRSRNSEATIQQALQALQQQTLRDYQLLVIDSSSTDRTREIAASFEAIIRTIPAQAYFPGKVLNEAMREIESEIVIFLNSDTVLSNPEALENLLKPFSDPNVAATYARQLPQIEAEPWVRKDYAASFPAGEAPAWMEWSLPLAAMRRSVWQQRPFYELAWASEDTEWGHWAKQAGQRIVYVPEAQAIHSHNYTLKQLYGRKFVEGEADAFIYRKQVSFWHICRRIASSTFSDMRYYLKHKEWRGLCLLPFRRIVYYWAYYRGHKWGELRIARGDADASKGQQEVLSRYEP